MSAVLIVGWDGGSWNVIRPLMQRGRLPNLTRLCRDGCWGPLRAPWPPVTFPSWTTFMTGVNPGRHGIFDFTRREEGRYRVRFVNAGDRQSPSLWSILSQAGKRVCVLGLPATYPPEEINGILVSGFDTPVTTRADDSFVFPPSAAALIRQLGGFPFADFQEFEVNHRWYVRARASLLRAIARKTELAKQLLCRERWDCFVIVFGETDTASHHFWHFADPYSPLYDAVGAGEFGETLAQVYEALDEALGALVAAAPAEANVLLVSDHGFGGSSGRYVHLNRWLAEQGWLRFLVEASSGLDFSWVKRLALRCIPARLQAPLFRLRDYALANTVESQSRFAGIDFSTTVAFADESPTFPGIWLNVRGRDEHGVVAAKDYESVRQQICEALESWRLAPEGTPVVARVWRREELYHGPFVDRAPDVVLELGADPKGYSIGVAGSRGHPGPLMSEVDRSVWRGGKLAGLSGSHRQDGVYVLAGPGVRGRGEAGADMTQMTPSVLGLCKIPFDPQFFDGEMLDTVVSSSVGDWVSNKRIPVRPPAPYTAEQERMLEERLRALGYLE